ncbi:MAG: GDSL-type esterase/lipase family protein [Lachnospiraceae bacterium]
MKYWKTTFFLTVFLLFAGILGFFSSDRSTVYAATKSDYQFDFGGNGTQSGFTGVSASDGYDQSKGYGFHETGNVANVSASGTGELSDAVQFKTTNATNTFDVDLPNGLYEITVILGNTNRTSVWAEGCLQIINMTGNNATHTLQLPVTDGQLNIRATAGKDGYAYTMSALKIKKVSDDPTLPPTIWICGDSTVCNYYPLNSSTQAGWGQVLDQYIDTSKWQIRNLAASGQYAKGFVDAGQFDPVLNYGKKGDIYIISIGINDTNYSNETEYYDTVTDMTKKALAKEIQVYLVKQQGRADDISRSKLLTGRWFGGALDKIGTEQNVPVIDLFNLAQDYFLSIGQEKTYDLYMDKSDGSKDTLHPNREGAKVLAKLVAEQLNLSGSSETPSTPSEPSTPDVDPNPDEKRYYASDAAYTEGWLETEHAGFRGKGYVNLANKVGSTITWHVRAEKKGNYLCTFRIASGSQNDRPMMLTVNQGSDQWKQSFLPTGAYTTWEERGIVLPLRAGVNRIQAVSLTDEGSPNFDYLKIELTDEPIAETYDPNASETPSEPVTASAPTIYIAGDSTCQSYRASYAPQQGWGYYLKDYVKTGYNVENHAIAGRSSKSFYDNGRLQTILDKIQANDYLLIQFGINDSASSNAERYAPVCGNVSNPTTGSFEYYIKFYVEGAKEHQATPVLISPTLGLKAYSNGKFVSSYTNYANAMKNIADHYQIPYIDLNSLMVDDYNKIGYDKAKLYHLAGVVDGSTDGTHFSEEGAQNAAKLVCGKLNSILPDSSFKTNAYFFQPNPLWNFLSKAA